MKQLITKGLFLTFVLAIMPTMPTAEQDRLIRLLAIYLESVSLKAEILKDLPAVLALVPDKDLSSITWAHKQLSTHVPLQELRTKLLGMKEHVSEAIVLRIPKEKAKMPEIVTLSSAIHKKRQEILQQLSHDNFLIAQALEALNKS